MVSELGKSDVLGVPQEVAGDFVATKLPGILDHYRDWPIPSAVSASHLLGEGARLSQGKVQDMQHSKFELMARLHSLRQAEEAQKAAMQVISGLAVLVGAGQGWTEIDSLKKRKGHLLHPVEATISNFL